MPTPLVSLGRPTLPTSEADLCRWQPWAAAVLGALAALDGPLGTAGPRALSAYFPPLVVGAATLLVVLRDECRDVAVAWDAVALGAGGVRVRFVDGRSVTVADLERLAPAGADRSWLAALIGLAQLTVQAVDRWPELPPALPAPLRTN